MICALLSALVATNTAQDTLDYPFRSSLEGGCIRGRRRGEDFLCLYVVHQGLVALHVVLSMFNVSFGTRSERGRCGA